MQRPLRSLVKRFRPRFERLEDRLALAGAGAINHPPTDILLDNASVPEFFNGSVIGRLRVVDEDAQDTHRLQLTEDDGRRFQIGWNGNELELLRQLDYETAASHFVTIRATDPRGLFVEKTFEISVTDVNDPPSAVIVSGNGVPENSPPGTVIGELMLIDAEGDVYDFNNAIFASSQVAFSAGRVVVGDQEKIDFEVQKELWAYVALPGISHSSGYRVSIPVIDVNEPPLAGRDRYILPVRSTEPVASDRTVLFNDPDPEQGLLSAEVVESPQLGEIELARDGSFRYVPGANFWGVDHFSYRVNDAEFSSPPTIVELFSHEAQLVRRVYWNVLSREPDPQGWEFWTRRLSGGEINLDILATAVLESDEYANDKISRLYWGVLHRPADAAGLAYWREEVWKRQDGQRSVRAGILASDEYFALEQSQNREWVHGLYLKCFENSGDEAGINYWTKLLDEGKWTRQEIASDFLDRPQSQSVFVRDSFNRMLRRYPYYPSDNDWFVGQLQAGVSENEVRVRIIDSEEYASLTAAPANGTAQRVYEVDPWNRPIEVGAVIRRPPLARGR